MASLKIEAHDKDKGLYLIKADDLFLKETFGQVKPAKRPGTPPTAFSLGNMDKNKTKISSTFGSTSTKAPIPSGSAATVGPMSRSSTKACY